MNIYTDLANISIDEMIQVPHCALSVLIVDDERHMVSELEEALTDCGYNVHTALSAAEAAKLLRAHPEIGVMISDIRMPGCDGIELTRQVLAERSKQAALEVILVTGHATLDDAVSAMRNGAFDFVRKPFRLKDIFEATGRAMARSIGRRELETRMSHEVPSETAFCPCPQSATTMCLFSLLREIQAPLTPILGYAKLLEQDQANIAQYAREIRLGAQRLIATMDDLATLSLAESGGLKLRKTAISAQALIDRAIEQRIIPARAKGTQLRTAISPDVTLEVDPAQFAKVLDVLLHVAIELTPCCAIISVSADATPEGALIRFDGQLADRETVAGDQMADATPQAAEVAPVGVLMARRLIDLYGGRLSLSWSEQHAFRATVSLPA